MARRKVPPLRMKNLGRNRVLPEKYDLRASKAVSSDPKIMITQNFISALIMIIGINPSLH